MGCDIGELLQILVRARQFGRGVPEILVCDFSFCDLPLQLHICGLQLHRPLLHQFFEVAAIFCEFFFGVEALNGFAYQRRNGFQKFDGGRFKKGFP